MKKTVIILIGIIYAASIMLVTFYGLVTEDTHTDSVPVRDIVIVVDGNIEGSGEKYVMLNTPYVSGKPLTYQIQYKLNPPETTNKKVIFEVMETYATVNENGLVTIAGFENANDFNVVTIKVYATDDEGNKNTAITGVLYIFYTVSAE